MGQQNEQKQDGADTKTVSAHGYSDDYGRNVANILTRGSQVVRCDFGGPCNREYGAQCAAVCRRMRGEA